MALYDIRENLDDVPEDERSSYTEENGVFKRDANGDFERLKAKHSEGEKHKTKAEKERDELKSRFQKQEAEAEAEKERIREEAFQEALKSNKVEQINESWQTKYDTDLARITKERDEAIEGSKAEIDRLTRGVDIANIISETKWGDNTSKQVELLRKDLLDRTVSIKTDTGYETRFKNADGTPSAISLQEGYKKEVLDSGDYISMLAGNQASGGGAIKKSGSGAVSGGQKLSNLSEAQRLELAESNPDGFNELRAKRKF